MKWRDALKNGCADATEQHEALAEINRLGALLSPEGTRLERQSRLVEIAKWMGFEKASEAWWDDGAAEYPLQDIYEAVENGGVDDITQVNLGLFLHGDHIYTTCCWSDGCGGGEVEYGHFDTREEAVAWAANDKKAEDKK